jgi:hypothetical protein
MGSYHYRVIDTTVEEEIGAPWIGLRFMSYQFYKSIYAFSAVYICSIHRSLYICIQILMLDLFGKMQETDVFTRDTCRNTSTPAATVNLSSLTSR